MDLNYLEHKFRPIEQLHARGDILVSKIDAVAFAEFDGWCRALTDSVLNKIKLNGMQHQFRYDIITREGNLMKFGGAFYNPIDIYKNLCEKLPEYSINFTLLLKGVVSLSVKK